jgi:hypothetical protein
LRIDSRGTSPSLASEFASFERIVSLRAMQLVENPGFMQKYHKIRALQVLQAAQILQGIPFIKAANLQYNNSSCSMLEQRHRLLHQAQYKVSACYASPSRSSIYFLILPTHKSTQSFFSEIALGIF